jgi:hypothetical protein
MVGRKFAEPWRLQVVEELGPTAPGRPYGDIFEAMAQLHAPANATT